MSCCCVDLSNCRLNFRSNFTCFCEPVEVTLSPAARFIIGFQEKSGIILQFLNVEWFLFSFYKKYQFLIIFFHNTLQMCIFCTDKILCFCFWYKPIFSPLLFQISYGRFSPNSQGYRDLDLFIQQKDGKKIVDPEKQSAICSRLKMEMLHPLRVIIANRGPDTELLVANPVELCGKGRPRVFYDVTLALKVLGICVFSVRIITSEVIQRPISMLCFHETCYDIIVTTAFHIFMGG